MGFLRFGLLLSFIGVAVILTVFAIDLWIALPEFSLQISVVSVLLFSAFCLVIYWVARRLAASANLYKFNNVILMSIMGKLALTMAFLGIFRKIFMPESKYVYVPFLIIYIVYTIFETYFLTIIGKQKRV